MQEDPKKTNSFWDFLNLPQSILGVLKSMIWQHVSESINSAFSTYFLYNMQENSNKK